MLSTLLVWHLTATAALLLTYATVVGLQWSAGQLRRLVADLEHRRALRPAPVRRDADGVAGGAVRSAA